MGFLKEVNFFWVIQLVTFALSDGKFFKNHDYLLKRELSELTNKNLQTTISQGA